MREDRVVGERDVVVAVEGVRHVDAPPCTACVGEGELAVSVEHAVVEQPVGDNVVRLWLRGWGGGRGGGERGGEESTCTSGYERA